MGLFTKSIRRSKGNEDNANDSDVPGWLKMLQDNSWELEILISGGAIFSLLQLSGFTVDFFYQLSYTNFFIGRNMLFMFVMLAIKGLTLGFAVHIIVRSFWVSLIALSSISKENDGKEIKYAKPFKADNNSRLSDLIVRVDKIAGWLMYNSLNIVWIISGGLLLMFVLIPIGLGMEKIMNGLGKLLLIPVGLYYLDLFTFSGLRKIKGVSYLLYPFFAVFDLLTLRFIYQKGFIFIAKHISRWKVFAFYIVFIFSSLLFTYLSIFRIMHWPNVFDERKHRFNLAIDENQYTEFLYRNKTDKGRSHVASIQSDIISDPVINLFINYSVVYDQFIDSIENKNNRYFEKIWQVSVDDSVYTNLKYYTIHGNNSTSMGINTYVDVGNFNQGPHVLTVTNIYEDPESKRKKLSIPFWLDKEADQ